jgi:hypothetical protein
MDESDEVTVMDTKGSTVSVVKPLMDPALAVIVVVPDAAEIATP